MDGKHLSSVDLAAIVTELQVLEGGKISQLYDYGLKGILLQVHLSGEGKHFLRILPGAWLNLTSKEDVPLHPSGFCLQLRKYLENSRITKIQQHDSERIAILHCQKEREYQFIIEFFSHGNIILTDAQTNTIIAVQERHVWKDRSIQPGETYQPPPAAKNWKTIREEELSILLQQSGKKNVAGTLAMELGVGGMTAEDLCRRAEVDKRKLPAAVAVMGQSQVQRLFAALQEIKQLITVPKGYRYEQEIMPYPLRDVTISQITATFNEALNTVSATEKKSPYEKKKRALETQITLQQEAITHLQEKATEETRRGELIYENYSELQQLISRTREMKKDHSWEEVARELRTNKIVKMVNLKEKTVMITI